MLLNSNIAAIECLAVRILGPELARSFRFEPLSDVASNETFTLNHLGREVLVQANSTSALARGLYWYLTQAAGAHVSWYGSHLGRVKELPVLPEPIRQASWARWRYFLNYCSYSYSLAFWKWEQWEPLIDWMALQGINLPLALTGQEAVWRRFGQRFGLCSQAMNDFLPGPAYLPFGWMGCLDGWTGPLSEGWIDGHEQLACRILSRQRELGMTPVLQGFTGHVPAALMAQFPQAKAQKVTWSDWETNLLDPSDPLFAQTAKVYLEEQNSLFGTDHYYAADPFIEMIPPSGDLVYLAELAQAIYQGMAQSDPKAVWVLQGWPFHYQRNFWTPPRVKALLDAIPQNRILLLDLYGETHPMWEQTEAFHGKPWLWCNVQNFGRNVVLSGTLEANNTGLTNARLDSLAQHLSGLGMVNEGLDYNPAVYEFFFECAWREEPIDLAAWGRRYAAHRYGCNHAATAQAWEILATKLYRWPRPEESGIIRCPTQTAQIQTDTECEALREVWSLLLSTSEVEMPGQAPFHFDLILVGRQVLSNLGNDLKKELQEAVAERNVARFAASVGPLRELICDLADLLSAHPEFCLEPWVQSAESWAFSNEERACLRQSALSQITLWADRDELLRDYARKEWSGLLREFYLPRWEAWFAMVEEALHADEIPDEKDYLQNQVAWERAWIRTAHPLDPPPQAPIAISKRLHQKYLIRSA